MSHSSGTDTSSSRIRGVNLAGLLFFDYLSSPLFSGDVLRTMIDAAMSCVLGNRTRKNVLSQSVSGISRQMVYRITECCLLAIFVQSRFTIFRSAAVFQLLFPYVQHYHFSRCWVTRLFNAVTGLILPSFIRQFLQDVCPTVAPLPESITRSTNNNNNNNNREKGNVDMESSVPVNAFQESLRFYRYSYDLGIPYAVIASGLVSDIAHAIVNQIPWAVAFYRARGRHTSQWWMLKPYLCSMVEGVTQGVLVHVARITGALVGRQLSRGGGDGPLFWGERVLVLAAAPLIHAAASHASARLRQWLEVRHPPTAEDARESQRQAEAAEAAAQEEEEAAQQETHGGGPLGLTTGAKVDLYAVLGVPPSATTGEIKKAYRTAALRSHPDRVAHDPVAQQTARENMAMINQAYEILCSEQKRRQYDMNRMVGDVAETVRGFENMSPLALSGLGAAGVVGMSITASVLVYLQYVAVFQQLTSPGNQPLRFLGFI